MYQIFNQRTFNITTVLTILLLAKIDAISEHTVVIGDIGKVFQQIMAGLDELTRCYQMLLF